MKTASLLVLFVSWVVAANVSHAQSTEIETVVHTSSHVFDIELNASTVLCSEAAYSAPFLKVLIPKLADLTLLNHQNIGAGAPCVAAGKCGGPDGLGPNSILDPNKPTETVTAQVQAVRKSYKDAINQTCQLFLIERVSLDIRGFAFFHEVWDDLGSRPFSDCP